MKRREHPASSAARLLAELHGFDRRVNSPRFSAWCIINSRELISASCFIKGSYELWRVLNSMGPAFHIVSYKTLSHPSSLQSITNKESFSALMAHPYSQRPKLSDGG